VRALLQKFGDVVVEGDSRPHLGIIASTGRASRCESWSDHGDIADALAAYERWHPQVQAILQAVDETFIWALFDRPPLERWSLGR
jgi:hypothetical protein